jgi:hypothetical protein
VIAEMTENSQGANDSVFLQLMCLCLHCILKLILKFLDFLTARAYIIVVVKGQGFYDAAKGCLFLLLRNLVLTVVLEKVLPFVFLIAEFFIVIISTCFLFLCVYPQLWNKNADGNDLWPIILLIGFVVIYFVVDNVLDTYSYSVLCIFISFVLDKEMGQTTPTYVMTASRDLKDYMKAQYSEGYTMCSSYQEKHKDFNLAY